MGILHKCLLLLTKTGSLIMAQGKYVPRSALFSAAQHYWMYSFYHTIKSCGGKTPSYLQYEVEV